MNVSSLVLILVYPPLSALKVVFVKRARSQPPEIFAFLRSVSLPNEGLQKYSSFASLNKSSDSS